MLNGPKTIYWDANCFLAYVNEETDRVDVLNELLVLSASGEIKLYASTISQVEVAFSDSERRRGVLEPETERRIDSLWNGNSAGVAIVNSVDFNDEIGGIAKNLMRHSIARGWSLKPLDAIHLATAQWLPNLGAQVDEFHTYDGGLSRYSPIVGFPVSEPRIPL